MEAEKTAKGAETPSHSQSPDPTIKKQRSRNFRFHTPRSRPSSSKGMTVSTPSSPVLPVSMVPPIPGSTSSDGFTNPRPAPRPISSPRSSSHDPYRRTGSPTLQNRKLRHIPSEASRLRALNIGQIGTNTDGRPTHDVPQPENFSRPRKHSIRRSEESQHTSPPPTIQPLQPCEEITISPSSRNRGISVSSSSSRSTTSPVVTIRPSMSIPDLNASETAYSRHRNFTNSSHYPPRKGHTIDSYSNHLREPHIHPAGFDSEEVRASFRSALTTSSSFIGNSGTERSSVMTKSSSNTSIFGRDEGFSVEDAIGMYESGFDDSTADDGYNSRPDTAFSNNSYQIKHPDTRNDSLQIPANILVHDADSFFQEPLSFNTFDGNAESILTPKPNNISEEPPGETSQQVSEDMPTISTASQPAPKGARASRDRYGFRKDSQYVSLEAWEAWNTPYEAYLSRRRKKWVALLRDHALLIDNPTIFPPKSTRLKRFVRKGIPPDWRGAAWFHFAGGSVMIEKHPGLYDELLRRASSGSLSATDEEIIERDLNRTFPDNVLFKPDPIPNSDSQSTRTSNQTILTPETPLLQSLRRVLQAFAIYNPKIGYCQSLNFLAGLLLLFMNEERSFWLLNIITRVYLPGTHEVNLEGANVDLGVLMTSVKESMPNVWAKIGGELDGSPAHESKVSMRLPPITLCCTAWFMSCFIGNLPIETTLRVWDSFFYEGSKTLFRIALAVFKVGEPEIRAVSDPMEVFQVVQGIPRKLIDANALMEACFKRRNGFGHLSQETIEARRRERREGYAEERRALAGGVVVSPVRKNTMFRRRGRGKGGPATVETP